MNADLEKQLGELGPECRAVVDRLRAARTVEPREENRKFRLRRGFVGRERPAAEWLAAASLLVALGLTAVFLSQPPAGDLQPSTSVSFGAREYRLTPEEIIATQRPDGGWQNDFLTRRNAEVLARCEGTAARIAYKRAVRNLRAKGVL